MIMQQNVWNVISCSLLNYEFVNIHLESKLLPDQITLLRKKMFKSNFISDKNMQFFSILRPCIAKNSMKSLYILHQLYICV